MRGPHCAPRIDTEDKSSVRSEEDYCHDVKGMASYNDEFCEPLMTWANAVF